MSTRDRYQPIDERCRRCGSALPAGASFCAECGLDARPIPRTAPGAARAPRWLLPAVAVGGALALVGGIVLALALRDPAPISGSVPSAGGSESVTPSAAASLNGTATPSATPGPTATPLPAPVFANRSIVEVTQEGDRLLLRTGPGGPADEIGTLRTGARLFTIGAPEDADGYRWYRVAIVSGPFETNVVDLSTSIGWVASPPTGEAWLAAADVACGSPTTVVELAALLPLERLACFGRDELTLTGVLESPPCDACESPVTYSPAWLAGPDPNVWFAGTDIRFRPAPDAIGPITEVTEPMPVRVTAHLEDPDAASCRIVDPGEGLVEAPADVVLNCRTTLVVTEFEFLD